MDQESPLVSEKRFVGRDLTHELPDQLEDLGLKVDRERQVVERSLIYSITARLVSFFGELCSLFLKIS